MVFFIQTERKVCFFLIKKKTGISQIAKAFAVNPDISGNSEAVEDFSIYQILGNYT